MLVATDDDRLKASQIIAHFRTRMTMRQIASYLKIPVAYCHFTHSINNRKDNPKLFLAPKWVIREILSFKPDRR